MIITYPNNLNDGHFFQINTSVFQPGNRIICQGKDEPKLVKFLMNEIASRYRISSTAVRLFAALASEG